LGTLVTTGGGAIRRPSFAAGEARVFMVDNEPDLTNWHFDPAQLTVPVGATVVWQNKGQQDHTVTADDKSFDSGYVTGGSEWQRAFPNPGTYAYHCQPHPWMTGVIRVVSAAAAAQSTTTATTATTVPPPTSTTLPASLATQPPRDTGSTTTAPAPPTSSPPPSGTAAAPTGKRTGSRGGLAGTVAIVVVPTLAALALGARLRRNG
jgi:plastocyanin